jgi:hypothetical protein
MLGSIFFITSIILSQKRQFHRRKYFKYHNIGPKSKQNMQVVMQMETFSGKIWWARQDLYFFSMKTLKL